MKKLLIISLLLFAHPSFSKEGQMMEACKSDVEKHCSGVEPGEGRIIKCLMGHKEHVSETCKNQIKETKEDRKEKRAEFKEACAQDVKTHCGDVSMGKGAIMKCLHGKKESLSAGCRETMGNKKFKGSK